MMISSRTLLHALGLLALCVLAAPAVLSAHVGIRPRESAPGAEQRYFVRVPTEGTVSTTSVRLVIPDGVTVLDVEAVQEGTFDVEKQDGRIVAITWKKEVEPKEIAELYFRAKNPSGQAEIVWKAHQHFADGTRAEWVEAPGAKRPAPVTKLVASPAAPAAGSQPPPRNR